MIGGEVDEISIAEAQFYPRSLNLIAYTPTSTIHTPATGLLFLMIEMLKSENGSPKHRRYIKLDASADAGILKLADMTSTLPLHRYISFVISVMMPKF
jgi:hypothetical protein